MEPFSIENWSDGNFWLFHSALIASSTSSCVISSISCLGMLFCMKNGMNWSLIIFSLKSFVNGPAYDMNADDIKESPATT